jgi:ABC-type nitrate/sulfonate/bicarbonate transport system ATPase subunit
LKEEYKTTDVIVTHDIQESIILGNKIYVLRKDGTLSNAYEVNRNSIDIQELVDLKKFLKQNNDIYLNIQDEILNNMKNIK